MSEKASTNTNLDKIPEKKLPRFKELAIPKVRIDNTIRLNAFQVKPAALTYEITDSLNKLAEPRRRYYRSDTYRYSSPSFLSLTPSLKPENSSQESSPKANLETYANIAARRNIPYPKRIRDFLKPMKDFSQSKSGSSHNENKFSLNLKTFKLGNKRSLYKKSENKV